MKTSVALATYNGHQFLAEQLSSVLAQEQPIDEIVVSDDHSSDETLRIAKQILANADARSVEVKIVESSNNQGVVRNFEQAIAACTGDVVFLCDQDDYWMPNKTTRILEVFARSPETLLIYSDAILVDSDRNPLHGTQFSALEVTRRERELVSSGRAFDALVRRNLVTGATAAFRRTLFEIARPLPPEWVHDEWLAIVASAFGRVDFVDDALIEYRQHGGNEIGLRELGPFEKFSMIFNSRGDFCHREARRAQVLLDRLESIGNGIDKQKLESLRQKIEHFQFRDRLPRSRLSRIGPMTHEALSGRYFEHGRGIRSIVRDLFESL